MPERSSERWIEALFDSFEEIEVDAHRRDPIGFPGYTEAPEGESVVAGLVRTDGVEAAAAVFDFRALGGSMGEVAGARIEAAMEAALRRKVPFILVTSTGGARMQEGMAGLAQMARTAAASAALGAAGLPRISVLGDPTTGGVYASAASLGDFIVAEQGATIGFAGPRVAEALQGEGLPEGSYTAEAAFRAGLVDAVFPQEEIRGWLGRLLKLVGEPGGVSTPPEPGSRPPEASGAHRTLPAAEEFALARHPDRPAPRFYIEQCFDEFLELHGDRAGSDDPAVVVGLGSLGGRTLVVASIDRARPNASGYRKARRAINLAHRLGFPLVTLVDTPGADASLSSEYSGLASEIAHTLEALLTAETSVISIVTGEGGSGGALALACGDRVAIQSHAVFSVIAPEGAAAILHRDPSRADEVAGALRPTSHDLVSLGLADAVIPEPDPGAHAEPDAAAESVAHWLAEAIATTQGDPASRAGRFPRLKPIDDKP